MKKLLQICTGKDLSRDRRNRIEEKILMISKKKNMSFCKKNSNSHIYEITECGWR